MQTNLNVDQKAAYYKLICASADVNAQIKCFFIVGPGGCGKIFLYKWLISTIRGEGYVVIPSVSTGIAANLLAGGRTYHSLFKVPVPVIETSVSSMRNNSIDAENIRHAKMLILDEATMAPHNAIACINRLLQEIMRNNKPFGGKLIILGGDFRQTLPVVPHGSRSAIIEASIKFNNLWNDFNILKLTSNVRSVDPTFSDWLIKLGNGELTNDKGLPEDIIEIPDHLICEGSLIKEIFGDSLSGQDIEKYSTIAILTPKNTDVDDINEEVLSLLDETIVTYLSTDSIDDSDDKDKDNYPIEFLHELTPSGMPVHNMHLKVGSIIMLLRNLHTKRGLCNGTRLCIQTLKTNLIIA